MRAPFFPIARTRRQGRRRAVVLLLALFVALSQGVSAETRTPPYRVIVNSRNPASTADRQFLADAFLKKTTTWPNGQVIRPADLAPSSPVRRQFSDEVLHRSVEEVKSYWQQRIFSGRDVPPPEFETDEDAVAYVLKHDGAVGYVSGGASLRGTRVLGVR